MRTKRSVWLAILALGVMLFAAGSELAAQATPPYTVVHTGSKFGDAQNLFFRLNQVPR